MFIILCFHSTLMSNIPAVIFISIIFLTSIPYDRCTMYYLAKKKTVFNVIL